MAMITPTRLGLKYAPIPTLALEYEEDLGVVESDDGTRSLYVFKEAATSERGSRRVRKKLHVVELPQLTGHSEPLTVVRQLQKDNQRFLGPSVVKEQQLQRLLQQLVDHLPGARGTTVGKKTTELELGTRLSERVETVRTHNPVERSSEHEADDEDDQQLEESVVEESAAEASMEASRADEEDNTDHQALNMSDKPDSSPVAAHRTGKFITQEESDHEDDTHSGHNDEDEEGAPQHSDHDRAEAEEDEKKKKALKSESDGSEEEDVQSEELEYFSEDGSDEDSF